MITGHVFIATSLDGFISRADGGIDWLLKADTRPEGEDYGYAEFIAGIDAIVMGRGSFDMVSGFADWPYPKPVVVLSDSLAAIPAALAGRVTLDRGPVREVAARLAAAGRKRVYVDGGETIRRFLAAGLIADLIVTRVPVLIGTGRPLFGPLEADLTLIHEATRAYPNGLVQSRYRIG